MSMEKDNLTNRERIILLIYCIYTFIMIGVIWLLHWDHWIIPIIITGMILAILMHINKYRTYKYRAVFTSLMMWMNFSIYLINTDDFTGAFSTMAAMIIVLAVYCIPEISYIGAIIYTFHLLYHLIIVKNMGIGFTRMGLRVSLRIVSVYVVLYATYKLIKSQLEANKMLLENVEEIKQAQQSKDDFMANMSHEIRTPINTICGISEIVLREDLSDKVRDDVYDIQAAGRSLLSIVSDILDFTELTSGKMELVPGNYNITSTINDILNMASSKAFGKRIEIIVDCDSDIPRSLIGDEQKISRAIMNVLDNAIKFTNEGGILIKFYSRKESYGVNLVVTITDTGIGMTEEALETVFTRFSQVDTKRNRQVSGIGLGLSITKAIVNKMGGFISLSSKAGEGTTVQLVFPQEVGDELPVVKLNNSEKFSIMLYLDTTKYKNILVRDGYAECIGNIVKNLNLKYRQAKSLKETKHRMENEEFTHLFISWKEYCEDRQYFEEMSKKVNVILVLERDHKESVMGSRLLCVYKPFYILTIATILNGEYVDHMGKNYDRGMKFIAPDVSVLVVDDNLMNLKVIEGLLRPYKIKVFVAESGMEALEKVETNRFDIIFMDHMMPEMDGVETFHRIRKMDGSYFKNVPVIALTANAIAGAREMFLHEGFADYVAKPIEISMLERVLYKFIPEEYIKKEYDDEDENVSASSAGVHESEGKDAFLKKEPEETIDIDGLDVETGLAYCGDNMNDYIDVVRTYYKIGYKRLDEIRKYLEHGDIKNYTTLVHALKSTSLSIGAKELSKKAKELESAGNTGDLTYISANTERVLLQYKKLLDDIESEPAFNIETKKSGNQKTDDNGKASKDGRLTDMDLSGLDDKFEGLLAALESFEMDNVQRCFEELDKYAYKGTPVSEMLKEVKNFSDEFDFACAGEELSKLREGLKG